MKKRILALAMAAVMAGSLTACSGSSGTDSSGGNRSSGFREQIRSKGRVQGRGRGCRKHILIQGRSRRL